MKSILSALLISYGGLLLASLPVSIINSKGSIVDIPLSTAKTREIVQNLSLEESDLVFDLLNISYPSNSFLTKIAPLIDFDDDAQFIPIFHSKAAKELFFGEALISPLLELFLDDFACNCRSDFINNKRINRKEYRSYKKSFIFKDSLVMSDAELKIAQIKAKSEMIGSSKADVIRKVYMAGASFKNIRFFSEVCNVLKEKQHRTFKAPAPKHPWPSEKLILDVASPLLSAFDRLKLVKSFMVSNVPFDEESLAAIESLKISDISVWLHRFINSAAEVLNSCPNLSNPHELYALQKLVFFDRIKRHEMTDQELLNLINNMDCSSIDLQVNVLTFYRQTRVPFNHFEVYVDALCKFRSVSIRMISIQISNLMPFSSAILTKDSICKICSNSCASSFFVKSLKNLTVDLAENLQLQELSTEIDMKSWTDDILAILKAIEQNLLIEKVHLKIKNCSFYEEIHPFLVECEIFSKVQQIHMKGFDQSYNKFINQRLARVPKIIHQLSRSSTFFDYLSYNVDLEEFTIRSSNLHCLIDIFRNIQVCPRLRILKICNESTSGPYCFMVTKEISEMNFPSLEVIVLYGMQLNQLNEFLEYFPPIPRMIHVISSHVDNYGLDGVIYDKSRFSFDEPIESPQRSIKRAFH